MGWSESQFWKMIRHYSLDLRRGLPLAYHKINVSFNVWRHALSHIGIRHGSDLSFRLCFCVYTMKSIFSCIEFMRGSRNFWKGGLQPLMTTFVYHSVRKGGVAALKMAKNDLFLVKFFDERGGCNPRNPPPKSANGIIHMPGWPVTL